MTSERRPTLTLDPDARGHRYYRNAVERHWDPGEIDLDVDRGRLASMDDYGFDQLRRTLALFGAGEQAVTEDLSSLAVALEDPDDQLFVTTQLYEEAKHADFFDRYWRTVVTPAERERGEVPTAPTDDRWFPDDYVELFECNDRAMHRLLEADTPENRAKAYCHYHLVIEGILAQTGYYGVQNSWDGSVPELPELPGLVEGFTKIRQDEGRHVGFGMAKLKALVESGAVEPALLHETVNELVPLTQGIVANSAEEDGPGAGPSELTEYASGRHTQRMQQIVDASADIPSVDELTRLAGD
jgi:ribonucleoside-diphosphate reductase beta chain